MAVTTTIVKKVPRQAVVKFVSIGGGSANVDLANLAVSGETFDRANSSVTITGLFNTLASNATIVRNGANVLYLAASQQDKWDFTQSWGFVLDEQANANVTVNFVGDGSIILLMNKSAGYALPDLQTKKDYEK